MEMEKTRKKKQQWKLKYFKDCSGKKIRNP